MRVLLGIFLLLALHENGTVAEEGIPKRGKEYTPTSRKHRFPSVEERVKLYMSNWYVPPCEGYKDGMIRYSVKEGEDDWPFLTLAGPRRDPLVNSSYVYQVESIVQPDQVFFMDPDLITNCANATFDESIEIDERQLELASRIKFRVNMKMYCADVKTTLFPSLVHSSWEKPTTTQQAPILLQFGDNKDSHGFGGVMLPHIKKFRSAATSPDELTRVTESDCYSSPRLALDTAHGQDRFAPIVWRLASHRHYSPEKFRQVFKDDTPWAKKKDMAVFRGQLTGSRDGYDKNLSDEQNCLNLKRCRLVYKHANSTLIYAKLTSTRGRLPTVLNNVTLEGSKVNIGTLLEYKGLIMIEGNDVASGLKWALLSQSVVLMPAPKHTSWAMEELLEPWVHYIPLNDFATDVEEKMQWVLDNDKEAQQISERATLWMEDLVFHPDAAEDDRLIQEEILRRYQAHFLPVV